MVDTQVVCISTSTHRYSTDYHTAQTAKTSMSQYLQRQIWTITHNTKELSEVIHCNEVEVLNVLISDIVCTRSGWRTYWERKPTQIQLPSYDTASGSYCFSSYPGKYNGGFWGF